MSVPDCCAILPLVGLECCCPSADFLILARVKVVRFASPPARGHSFPPRWAAPASALIHRLTYLAVAEIAKRAGPDK
jgi:hypothetical protein